MLSWLRCTWQVPITRYRPRTPVTDTVTAGERSVPTANPVVSTVNVLAVERSTRLPGRLRSGSRAVRRASSLVAAAESGATVMATPLG